MNWWRSLTETWKRIGYHLISELLSDCQSLNSDTAAHEIDEYWGVAYLTPCILRDCRRWRKHRIRTDWKGSPKIIGLWVRSRMCIYCMHEGRCLMAAKLIIVSQNAMQLPNQDNEGRQIIISFDQVRFMELIDLCSSKILVVDVDARWRRNFSPVHVVFMT